MKQFKCKECNGKFIEYPCRKQVYCSRACAGKNNAMSNGMRPPISKEARKRQGITLSKKYIGEGNPGWKGNNISTHALHTWIRRHYGRPSEKKCSHCDAQAYDWANIDHKYKREIKDFIPLCRHCHVKYDIKKGLRTPTNQYLKK